MKELRLAVQADFSDCAIEDSIEIITEEIGKISYLLELSVSVFDAAHAVKIMIDYPYIRYVHITKRLHSGRYFLTDNINGVEVIGGID